MKWNIVQHPGDDVVAVVEAQHQPRALLTAYVKLGITRDPAAMRNLYARPQQDKEKSMQPLFKKNTALLIPVDGNVEVMKAGKLTLAAAQKAVEGYVEALQFARDGIQAQALFNEDGLSKKMKLNETASMLVGRPLVGPVIILTGSRRWT